MTAIAGRGEEGAEHRGTDEQCPAAHRRLPADRHDEPAAAVGLERGGQSLTSACGRRDDGDRDALTGGPADASGETRDAGARGALGRGDRSASVLELPAERLVRAGDAAGRIAGRRGTRGRK